MKAPLWTLSCHSHQIIHPARLMYSMQRLGFGDTMKKQVKADSLLREDILHKFLESVLYFLSICPKKYFYRFYNLISNFFIVVSVENVALLYKNKT